jgi:DNA polymerase IV
MSAPWQDQARLKWLFLDLNSYFASVEQQEDPSIRGKPVIVVPVETDSTCAIAASYEAKAFGIKTGTRVGEAKRLCPGLICVPARHDVYVDYHHRVLDELDRHIYVTKICSVDEVACELVGPDRLTANALALAGRIKSGIAARVGICLRSSIGLAPSQLLAKIASDLQKPDGLTVLGADRLPGPLLDLGLTDLPGIGRKMGRRLDAAGVRSVEAFWHLAPRRARAVWGGIGGEHFWYGLHGIDPPAQETQRGSISHSQVLAPSLRSPASAFAVAHRLLARAASRLRRLDYRARRLGLALRLERGGRIDKECRLPQTQDSFVLLRALGRLHAEAARELGTSQIRKIGVALMELVPCAGDQPDLFGWTPATSEDPQRLRLSRAMDRLNARYGRDTVLLGAQPALPRYGGAKVAFNRIPDRAEFQE